MTAAATVYDWHATPARGGPPAGRPRQRLSPRQQARGRPQPPRKDRVTMAARYWVLCSDELMATDPPWADVGLRPVEPDGYEHPGMRWWLFEDDTAPETLAGRRVELLIERRDGKPVLVGRRPAL